MYLGNTAALVELYHIKSGNSSQVHMPLMAWIFLYVSKDPIINKGSISVLEYREDGATYAIFK